MTHFHDLADTVTDELQSALRSIDSNEVNTFIKRLQEAASVYVVGKGRSGLQMQAFAMRLMHLGMEAYVVDAVTTPAINAGDLLVVGSASGRTPTLTQYAEKARSLNAQVALVTANKQSPLKADCTVYINAPLSKQPSDQTVLLPGSLFEHALGILLDLVVTQLMDELGTNPDEMLSRHANLE